MKYFITLTYLLFSFTSFSFFPSSLDEAFYKNNPEFFYSYLLQNHKLSAKDKERYLEHLYFLRSSLLLRLDKTFTYDDLKHFATGFGFSVGGILCFTMAYLVSTAESNLNEDRVAFVIIGGGIMLTYRGFYIMYRSCTKYYRLMDFFKNLALEYIITKIPTE